MKSFRPSESQTAKPPDKLLRRTGGFAFVPNPFLPVSMELNVVSFRWGDTRCAASRTLKSYLRSILMHKPARSRK
jgi:hypothetical protein